MDNPGDLMHLCRLCLVKDQVNIPIFEEHGDIRQIFVKISSCLPVKVSKDDQLPKRICDGCSNKLDLLYEFCNTSANSEKKLLSWLEQAGLKDVDTISAVAQHTAKPLETQTQVKQEALEDIHAAVQQTDHLELTDEGVGAAVFEENAIDESDEPPPPKRARRTAAVKAQINITPDSDDDDDMDISEPMTKVEDESDDSDVDKDPSYVDVPGTSADDQPGPSGVGKDGVEAPLFVDVKDYNEDPLGNQTEGIFEEKFEILNPSKFNIYPCSLCQKVFNSKRKLTAHQKNVHISGRPYKCAKCPKSFKCSTGLNQHQKSHSPRNKIECNICLKSLSTKFSFDLHMRRHNKEYVTKCEQCGMKFISKGELKLHTDSKHERAFLCIECGKRYSSKYSLDYHMQTHDPNFKKVVYKCEKCDSSFDTERNRKRHILKWHRDCPRKEFICDLCGKVLVNLESFKIHILGHNGAKPFECEYCGKKFLRRNTLKWHRNTHTGEKPYQCKICHQSFTQPSPLKRHVIAMHCK